ncbi:hypothetical protein [Salinimicrobium flavum]|uniref:SpoIIAA-like n=1 Tax=Salinimicrobium flavum TaxID=1737065 RepID=A0ABW5IZJ1_9FLAO
MANPSNIVDLDFTTLQFFEDYVISRLKEDIVFDVPQVAELVEVCTNHYGKKEFVYISKREYNYNVNPTIYFKLEQAKFLKGIAVVSQKASSLNMAHFEKNFSKVPYEVFLELEDAMEWAKKRLGK